jgi:UDP-4-amino-4,6-dideoxy-N-acetyl-beta-L-altrosamine transaminase
MIPYGHQDIRQEDIDAVISVLRSDFLTQGPMVPRFETALCKYTGVGYAVAVNSGTSALHLACLALGVGKGDRVWTVPNTFVASANAALYCGAEVDFVDIDPVTFNISPVALEEKLRVAKRANRLPKVLIPVHFAGYPTAQKAIWQLTQRYGVRIIEDAAHAVGAERDGEKVGSCRWSDITTFSFHPVKIITTGEGGAALTNDPELAGKMALLRSHGVQRDKKEQEVHGPWSYQQVALGFNYRMTDIQAALGCRQMTRIEEYVDRRNSLARVYKENLVDLALICPKSPREGRSAWHLYVIQVSDSSRRREIFEYLREEGIGVNVHYIPVYRQPWYQQLGFQPGYCPNAEKYYRRAITLPLFPTMTENEQEKIITSLQNALTSVHR